MVYRAIFKKGPPLRSPRTGELTRGSFYFCKMLFSLASTHKPDYLAVAVDPRSRTYKRREWYPDYKGNRKPLPGVEQEEIDQQIDTIYKILDAIDVPVLYCDQYEADDIIATVVSKWKDHGFNFVVVSRDKDLHQLVSDRCSIFDSQENEWITPSDVERIWGFSPDRVTEVQTLMGDSVDNIPGIRGVGKKRAIALLKKFGTVEGLVEASETLSPSMQKAISEADLELTKKLVTLDTDLPLSLDPSSMCFDGFDMDGARPLFKKLGFREWSK